ncbi:DNA-binding protein YobU [Fictibacillus macauensis ZFHKF-1]|uniref:DNA-binding protein YobU n=1 Tax=Fictibacillus macauensis ZFHKF-1 TaxID=1196324 RepID=I8UBA0_9BACL|nr:GyrI-like domain-containing protein [Fictibacillus macauensis]EIT84220.1 DNA-binding protein YobU [Fictibacillus macauensis ZFHKF-1]
MKEAFTLYGKRAVTTNEQEGKGQGVIPAMWADFYKQGAPTGTVYAVYTNYESNEHGAYTYGIGTEEPGAGVLAVVPKQDYLVFTTEKGPVGEVVPKAWEKIWQWQEQQERAYGTDFEVYDERAQNPEDAQVDIYISVKNPR